jgi:anti-sigma factor RsiW
MSDNRPIREDELHAYVDGCLDPQRSAEVEKRLAADPELGHRVAVWALHRDGLRQAFAAKFAEPVPESLRLDRLAERRMARARLPWGRVAAGLVLALALGAGGGWSLRGLTIPGEVARLAMQAATAHRVFATATGVQVDIGPADRAALVSWLGERLGRRIGVPDLSAFGYHLRGGRMLAAMRGPAVLLIYDDGKGGRLTVYVQPMRGDEVAPMQHVTVEKTDTLAWIRSRMFCSVIADGAAAPLLSLADQVRSGLKL